MSQYLETIYRVSYLDDLAALFYEKFRGNLGNVNRIHCNIDFMGLDKPVCVIIDASGGNHFINIPLIGHRRNQERYQGYINWLPTGGKTKNIHDAIRQVYVVLNDMRTEILGDSAKFYD